MLTLAVQSPLVGRVVAEYHESPGLNLTRAQMQRLLGVDAPTCSALLETLMEAHVLERNTRGQYVMFHEHP